ncbi:arsenic resistance N-acetyltransferase ArsN2 [Halosimplex halophilum]|uniref:arsenic resistance N-acetyltransferase ArsN2 n=1 Tax=Halosimplex halophilum TaxID=2559572 RepID=UPI00107FABDF|nr:arsenic resistance N-acetyltransferase ArsN2 [Halosimplex halophilum]
MAGPVVALDPADPSAEYLESVLAEAGLPTEDLGRDAVDCYVARASGERVGVGGLERHGRDGLLRSVAVEPEHRGAGYGAAIVDGLEREASDAGVDRLFLLTTTASDFFAGLGYESVEREDVPAAIRATEQFAELCPASATVMRKSL